MGLKSFFQRKDKDGPAAPPTRSRRGAAAQTVEAVQQARVLARRRLIGAVMLLGIGVIGFPLLFETQPRPIPVDLPIEIPGKDQVAPLRVPAPRLKPAAAASQPDTAVASAEPRASAPEIVETPAEAGREVAAPASASAAIKPPAKASAPKPAERPASAVHAAPPKPATAAAEDASRAKALLDGKPPAADGAGRFVVQVGAFAEATTAREARSKLEKQGIKTYTQVVETDAGKRIRVRVGPFASRDEADKAAAKIKAAGSSAAVLTL